MITPRNGTNKLSFPSAATASFFGGRKMDQFSLQSVPPSLFKMPLSLLGRPSRLRTALPLTVHSNPFSSLVSRGKKRIVKLYRTKRRGEREERFKCRFRQKADSKDALDRLRGGSPNLGIRFLPYPAFSARPPEEPGTSYLSVLHPHTALLPVK